MTRSLLPDLGRTARAALRLDQRSVRSGVFALCCCVALCVTALANHVTLHNAASSFHPSGDTVEMRYLIITSDRFDSAYLAVVAVLDAIGVPHTTVCAAEQAISYRDLSYGDRGFFQAIVLVFGDSGGGGLADLLPNNTYQALDVYSRRFWIRQLWLVAPPANAPILADQSLCETPSEQTVWAHVTDPGTEVFVSLNHSAFLPIDGVGVYHVCSIPGWTPLLIDRLGCWLAFGREQDSLEQLVAVVDHRPGAAHSQLLLGDMLTWAGRGVFLGRQRVCLSAHVDDIFISSSLFTAGHGAPDSQQVYRMSPEDVDSVADWQNKLRERYPHVGDFRLDFVFNGVGPIEHGPNDPLTDKAKSVKDQFRWISHTYSHLQMDDASEADAYAEMVRNDEVAKRLNLPGYHSETVVTGEMSGLYNPSFYEAARRAGILYVASDRSIADQRSGRPNRGIYAWYDPDVVLIPRASVEIYYDVTLPEELVEEYNWRHTSGQPLTYDRIIEQVSNTILLRMLSFEMNPLMFHQANLRFFDDQAERSLLTDVLTAAVDKYTRISNLPVANPAFEEIGEAFRQRMQCDEVSVEALIIDWEQVALLASDDVGVTITGVEAGETEYYAGRPTCLVDLQARQWHVVPVVDYD